MKLMLSNMSFGGLHRSSACVVISLNGSQSARLVSTIACCTPDRPPTDRKDVEPHHHFPSCLRLCTGRRVLNTRTEPHIGRERSQKITDSMLINCRWQYRSCVQHSRSVITVNQTASNERVCILVSRFTVSRPTHTRPSTFFRTAATGIKL